MYGGKPRPASYLPRRGATTVISSLRESESENAVSDPVTRARVPVLPASPKMSPPRKRRGKKPPAPCRFTPGARCPCVFDPPPAFAKEYPSIRTACDFADQFKSHRWLYACRASHTKKMSDTDFFKLLNDRFSRLPSSVSYLGVTAKSPSSGWSHVHFVIDASWDVFAPLFRLPKLNGLGFFATRTWRKRGGAVYPGGARGFLHYITEDGLNVFRRIRPRRLVRVPRGPDKQPRKIRANSSALASRAIRTRWDNQQPKGATA
jgi:hypothetical protein